MPTDRDIPEPPDTAPSAAVNAPQTTPTDPANATAGASQPPDEASIRERERLPPDTIILAPPMRCPRRRVGDARVGGGHRRIY
jgi:hypothetical protein